MTIKFTDNETDLSREYWTFYLIDNKLVLSSFGVETRATKRHSWKVTSRYHRLEKQYSSLGVPEITQRVKDLAIQNMLEKITVCTTLKD